MDVTSLQTMTSEALPNLAEQPVTDGTRPDSQGSPPTPMPTPFPQDNGYQHIANSLSLPITGVIRPSALSQITK
jgi:hypothetical protein